MKLKINILKMTIIFLLFILIKSLSFAEDINGKIFTASVASIRSWDAFDGKFPIMKNDEHWFLGDSILNSDKFPKNLSPDLALVEGKFTVSANDEVKELINFIQFGPRGNNKIPKASGNFCEIILFFNNNSDDSKIITLSNEDKKTLNLKLITENNKEIKPVAFRIPGFPNSSIVETSLFTSFEGTLSLSLQTGDNTWLLLVFDIPQNIKTSQLMLGSTSMGNIQLQNQINNSPLTEMKIWEDNCNIANEYNKLNFQYSKQGKLDSKEIEISYSTNRSALLEIFNRLNLEKEKDLKKKLALIIEIIKNAPANKTTFYIPGSNDKWYDVKLNIKQFKLFDEFISSIRIEAQKHGVQCNENSK